MVRRGDYERSWLRPDILAGLTVAAMLVPQAMAYAELAGLPPSAGFRAALVALPVYALLGTSRHLGIGPEPGTAVLSALAVAPLAAGDPDRYLALMALLAGLVGAIALIAGFLGLGFVAELLSTPVLVGYISGVGLTLLSSQLRSFFGVAIESDSFFPRFWEFFGSLGDIDTASAAIGLGTLTLILWLRQNHPALPGALIGLGCSIAAVAVFDLDVALVGTVDAAIPTLSVPGISIDDAVDLFPAAAGVALIGYTDNILTARSISSKHGYAVSADRELIALGAMNGLGAFAGGFPVSSSASRSFVPASIGSKSQLSSVVTLVSVLAFLIVGQDVLARIPQAGLAAVIVAAALCGDRPPGLPADRFHQPGRSSPGRGHVCGGHHDRSSVRGALRRRTLAGHHRRSCRPPERRRARRRIGTRRLDQRRGPTCRSGSRSARLPIRCTTVLRQRRVVPGAAETGARAEPWRGTPRRTGFRGGRLDRHHRGRPSRRGHRRARWGRASA